MGANFTKVTADCLRKFKTYYSKSYPSPSTLQMMKSENEYIKQLTGGNKRKVPPVFSFQRKIAPDTLRWDIVAKNDEKSEQAYEIGRKVRIKRLEKEAMELEDYYCLKRFENKQGVIIGCNLSKSGIYNYHIQFD